MKDICDVHWECIGSNIMMYIGDVNCNKSECSLCEDSVMNTEVHCDVPTTAHEAHFRCELYAALPYSEFRHSIKTKHALKRIQNWKAFLPLVAKDRVDNEAAATKLRLNSHEEAIKAVEDSCSEGDDVADTEYW